jgi:two-component system, OmpR family, KDP operon response regulator KdpE
MVTSLAGYGSAAFPEPDAARSVETPVRGWLSVVVALRRSGNGANASGLLAAAAPLAPEPTVTRGAGLRDALPALTRAELVLVELVARDQQRLRELEDLRGRIPCPVVAVVLAGDPVDRVAALEAGADGCLSWPADPRELVSVCRALIRLVRSSVSDNHTSLGSSYVSSDIEIDLQRRYVVNAGKVQGLSPTEVGVLRLLLASPDQVIPYGRVLQEVWGEAGVDNHLLREAIRRLRKKMEPDPAHPRHLLTTPWVGLRFRP